jgi:hypothetical protein
LSEPLIISAGMPRAGSGWYYNLIHDLVVSSGGHDARHIRRRFHLERFLTEVNCNIATLNFHRLFPVLLPARFGNKFVIKTHAGPNSLVRYLIQAQWIFVIYIYRDPRAALLSAFEYGQRATLMQRPNAFSHLANLDDAAIFIEKYVRIWAAWSKVEDVMLIRYEDLLSNYPEKFEQTIKFLDLRLSLSEREKLFDKYRPGKGDPNQVGTHFSQGEAERFRQVLPPEQLEQFSLINEPALIRMGYEK